MATPLTGHGVEHLRIDPEISGASIVIVGSFNPAIFHPAWLTANDVEPNTPEEDVRIDVVHKEVSKFSIDATSYFIDQDRFQIQTNSAPWIQILDKAVRILGELLPHTPLMAFGLNRDVHFRLKTPDDRMKLGRILAPTEPWGAFGEQIHTQDNAEPGGLLSLTIRGNESFEELSITKNLKIEPSALIAKRDAIFMQANFHYDSESKKIETRRVCDVLQSQFQKRINESEMIFDHIMGIV